MSRYHVGPDTTYSGVITVGLDSLVAIEYKNKIRQARVYDLKVRVEGEYEGYVSGFAAVRVRGGEFKQLIHFPGNGTVAWSSFRMPQSVLAKSPYLIPQPEGISELLKALTTSPLPEVSILFSMHLGLAPVPANLYVAVEVYLQADAEISP